MLVFLVELVLREQELSENGLFVFEWLLREFVLLEEKWETRLLDSVLWESGWLKNVLCDTWSLEIKKRKSEWMA